MMRSPKPADADAPSGAAERLADSVTRSVFRRSTVQTRLTVAFWAIGMMSLVSTLLAIGQLRQVQQRAEAVIVVERLVGELHAQAAANSARVTALTHSSDPALKAALAPGLAAAEQRAAALQQELEPLVADTAAAVMLKEAAAARAASLAAAGRADGGAWLAATDAYAAATRKLLEFHGAQGEGMAALAAQARRAGHELLAVYAAACVLIIPFIWLLMVHILKPMYVAVRIARKVADGDLTVKVRTGGRDELARLMLALDDMTVSLRRMVGEVMSNAKAVAATGAQVRESHVDLSDRTEQQASTLQETASSMEELTATVSQNAENARQASALALGAAGVAERGGAVVNQVVRSMSGISDSARRIEDIIGVIDGIAFQTNILALNAAVEAARAGEQGRGFAVVAAEVRSLAQRSAAAAREIKGLISESVHRVEDGTRLADAAGGTMGEILASVRKVSDLVVEIAAASDQQRAGIEQVNVAIARMDQAVQQNAALVEQTGSSTDALTEQSRALLQAVAQFKLQQPGGGEAFAASADAAAGPKGWRTSVLVLES